MRDIKNSCISKIKVAQSHMAKDLSRHFPNSYLADGNVKWYAHLENILVVLQKLKMDLLYDLEIPLLGIYPRE